MTTREGARMTKILILGANGQLARNTTRVLLRDTDAKLTLYLRRASRLTDPDPARLAIVDGDVLSLPTLKAAMKGQQLDLDAAGLLAGLNGQRDTRSGAGPARARTTDGRAAQDGPTRPRGRQHARPRRR